MPNEILWAEYPQYEGTDVFEHLNDELLGVVPEEDELDCVLSPVNTLYWLHNQTLINPLSNTLFHNLDLGILYCIIILMLVTGQTIAYTPTGNRIYIIYNICNTNIFAY